MAALEYLNSTALAGEYGRGLLASTSAALSIPGFHSPANETGTGRTCEAVRLNTSDPNNTLYQTWYNINCISTFTVDSQIFIT
jgi:hypothetical protein